MLGCKKNVLSVALGLFVHLGFCHRVRFCNYEKPLMHRYWSLGSRYDMDKKRALLFAQLNIAIRTPFSDECTSP
ncbi:hypothetical protein EDB81DRAFT_270041 [Dactylonectria macrodidyma]|uniref:Secreted protein n=1 Tax=Dactylonectria macrodidyma TaxID=307937 RepID=A0A9P9FMR1_9HYPO|nr:hypothetical protein EDB81DRAFT_270041 [Dactylonectria macrodidyma]